MLNDGIFLMIVGMGVVFSFLSVMVIAMTITAKVIQVLNKYCPEPVPATAKVKVASKGGDKEIAVVIAAIKALRK